MLFNIENEAVRDYVHNVKYANGFGVGNGSTKIKEYLSKYADEIDGSAVTSPFWTEQGNVLGNLLPDTTITTEGQLRMLNVPFVNNCRDIGGWPTTDGGHIAYGKIIRSAKLDNMIGNNQAIKAFKEIGVSVELDIDGGANEDNKSYIDGVTYYGGSKYSLGAYSSASNKTYATLKNTFTVIVNELKKGNTILIHCQAGADRTGILCFLLEALCGATEDSLIKDWELTGFSHLNTKYIDDENELRLFMKTLASNYGSTKTIQEQVEAYLIKMGITSSQISTLKSLLYVAPKSNSTKSESTAEKEVSANTTTVSSETSTVKESVSDSKDCFTIKNNGINYFVSENSIISYSASSGYMNKSGYFAGRDGIQYVSQLHSITANGGGYSNTEKGYHTFKVTGANPNSYCVAFFNSSKGISGDLKAFMSDENGNCEGTIPRTNKNISNAAFVKVAFPKNGNFQLALYK